MSYLNYHPLPPLTPGRLLRLPELLQYLSIGKTALYAGIKKGKYPPPIKLGPRTSAWRSDLWIPILERGTEIIEQGTKQ